MTATTNGSPSTGAKSGIPRAGTSSPASRASGPAPRPRVPMRSLARGPPAPSVSPTSPTSSPSVVSKASPASHLTPPSIKRVKSNPRITNKLSPSPSTSRIASLARTPTTPSGSTLGPTHASLSTPGASRASPRTMSMSASRKKEPPSRSPERPRLSMPPNVLLPARDPPTPSPTLSRLVPVETSTASTSNNERPASASASSEVETLRERVHELELQYRLLQAEHSRCRPLSERRPRAALPEGVNQNLLSLLNDRDTLGTLVRSMPKDQRMGLLAIIAESCRPSDIQAQIDILLKYKELRSGVLARLEDDLCDRVIQFLDRRSILQLRLVSKRFDYLATKPSVWKSLCRELEKTWDGMITLDNYHMADDGDWLGLYKRLWQREKHWTNGTVQSLAVLGGHTNYVTSLKLCGETLISGSYDDTIRIWHLPYAVSSAKAVPPPIVIPAKSVSDLDFYAPEQVLVTGSHDIGRASVWRQIDGEWKVEKILSGHLHGTRAVAINAQWLVSVGSDKAIVVWDWRTGNKIVRFGQQTNVCVGMNLLDNFIVTATVDGIIRSFSIAKREMLGQFRLADLAKRQPEYADKLKDIGVGALGMLSWFEAEGRFMACGNRDMVVRLAWDWADEEEQAEMSESLGPHPLVTDAASIKSPFDLGPSGGASPLRPRQSAGGVPSPLSTAPPRAPRASMGSPVKGSPAAKRLSSSTAGTGADEDVPLATTTGTTSKFALARWPRVVEILDITGTERGAFEAGRVRIVTSRRLSAKAGAERRVIVGTERESANGEPPTMKLVPLGGKWETRGKQAGLHVSSKNPMSLALDHDKLVYGCTDGSIVVAGFVGPTATGTTAS